LFFKDFTTKKKGQTQTKANKTKASKSLLSAKKMSKERKFA